MTDSKHSPLPWFADPDDREGMDWNIHIVEHNRPHMRICFMSSGEESEANAALIVRAVNAHDKLVAALEEFQKPENWRVNGRFDPESSNFDAYSFVDSVLASLKDAP